MSAENIDARRLLLKPTAAFFCLPADRQALAIFWEIK